jgi:hypothetical protein
VGELCSWGQSNWSILSWVWRWWWCVSAAYIPWGSHAVKSTWGIHTTEVTKQRQSIRVFNWTWWHKNKVNPQDLQQDLNFVVPILLANFLTFFISNIFVRFYRIPSWVGANNNCQTIKCPWGEEGGQCGLQMEYKFKPKFAL